MDSLAETIQGIELSDTPEEVIGNYKVGKVLGKGTFGIVKLGTHVGNGSQVAIKIIDHSRFQNESDHVCLRNEIDAMKNLTHKNIVQLYEVIEIDDKQKKVRKTCLVLEYLQGGELFDLIVSNNKLEENVSCKFLLQIIEALEYCHSNGVIHRDIKPENILLDSRGNVNLSDFGLSVKVPKDGSKIKSFAGSVLYSSPELLLSRPYVGSEIDIWSLGVTLYAMTTGLVPWYGETLREQAQNIVRGSYLIPDDVSIFVERLLARMLQANPKKRATLAEIKSIANEWLECLA